MSRAHGTKGEIVVHTFDPGSDALYEVERAVLRLRGGGDQAIDIESCAQQGKDLRLQIAGVRRREESEALVGATVLVYREDLEQPEPGEFFQGDLIGLEAFSPLGARLGRVEEIFAAGPVPNLVIRDGETELMIPFADDFVEGVDLERRRVTVRPLEFAE
ncbi:MAG: 16S rRNA processing protein RimM [Archangium sp.]|nr:16S rRNA processing protein RimM [Archangium sp.]